VTLMRFDPFRQLDRFAEHSRSTEARAAHSMPMEALRRGDQFLIFFDLPGVVADDVDITIERHVATVRAMRAPAYQEGDEVIIDERAYGEFSRQLLLADSLDVDKMTADMRDGVLTMTIPVSEASKPRRIPLGSRGTATSTEAGSTGDTSTADTSAGTTATADTAAAGDRSSTV
jgi:HSP20 family protein